MGTLSGAGVIDPVACPGLPLDNADAPVFRAPWEAHAFALVVQLHERGLFTWPEWAAALSAQIGAAQAAGDADLGDTYYRHWLTALETLVTRKGASTGTELARYAEAWDHAAHRTPHGQPIELVSADLDDAASMYHAGSRRLQDAFDTRRLADRVEERLVRGALTAEDTAFIESQALFMLATADAEGWPECSYKGGVPGFVRVLDPETLAFPGYDGNGMFRSLGNILVNPRVGLLFIDFEQPRRLRVQGLASIDPGDPLLESFAGAQQVVRLRVERVYPTCPRYIHPMQRVAVSPHAPCAGHTPPDAAWKQFEMFRDVLPRR